MPPSKVELFAAIRRDSRAGMSVVRSRASIRSTAGRSGGR